MRRGEWSLLLLRLLSVDERMKGHSDVIKLVLFLSQFHVYKFGSRLSKKNVSFFFKKLSVLNLSVENFTFTYPLRAMWHIRPRLWRTRSIKHVGRLTCSKYCFKRSAFLFFSLEIEIFWKITRATAFQSLCGFSSLTTRTISANKQFKNDKNINWTSLYLRHEKCNPRSVSPVVRMLSRSKIFAFMWWFRWQKGRPLVHRKNLAYLHFPRPQ